MLNNKGTSITLKKSSVGSLHLFLMFFFWFLCLASVLFLLAGIFFLITGDKNIFFIKDKFILKPDD